MEKIISFQSIIVAGISLFASALTISLTYYFTKKHQLKMEERRLKEEFYKTFIVAMNDLVTDNKNAKFQKSFSNSVNSLLLIADSEVVNNLTLFVEYIKNKSVNRNSDDWINKHDILLTKLIKSMRKDLFGNKYTDEKVFPKIIHLTGGKPKQ